MKRILFTVLILFICLSCLFSCVGSPVPPSGEQDPPKGPAGEEAPGGNDTPGGGDDTPGGEDEPADERPTPGSMAVEGAGASLSPTSLAASGRVAGDEVTEVAAAELARLITRDNLIAGKTYRISDSTPMLLELTRSACDGLGCVLIAPAGVTIRAKQGTTLQNISIHGPATVELSQGFTMVGVEITGGLTVEADSSDLRLEDCRLTAEGYAFVNRATGTTVVDCYMEGETALYDEASGSNLYEGCMLLGGETAVSLSGSGSTIWYSTIRGHLRASGENLLLALNRLEARGGITYQGTHNSVILLNEVEDVTVTESTSAYVCENAIIGSLTLRQVDYVLATRNRLWRGEAVQETVTNATGDNVTNTAERASYGVNEALLPHVDKDAYIAMSRMNYVRTADGSRLRLNDYISQKAESNGHLIIAPGAYLCEGRITLSAINDCTVYAYGVLYEKHDFFGNCLYLRECERLAFRGLTIDMVLNGCGHMTVLEKRNGTVYYRAAAGMLQNLADQTYFSEDGNGIAFMGYRADQAYPYADVSLGKLHFDEASGLLSSQPSAAVYAMLQAGDMMTCRGNGGNVVDLYTTTAVAFEDVSVLSGSIRCFWDNTANEGSILNRVLVSPAPAKQIDQATYEEYRALETQYGVSTGVYIDENGRYRGTPARTVTADATHTTYSRTGMQVTSCIFEGLSDDATNHQGSHGRIAAYNAETGEITYKQNLATLGYRAVCYPFAKGDNVYIYTSSGRLLCDTQALSASREVKTVNGFQYYSVKVDPATLDADALRDYNLDSDAAADPKIMIDNRSRNGDGFVYDNVLAQNIRSRGFLVKSSGNAIKNCSFYNIGMAAVGLIFEPEWGESGVSADTSITSCYFENTGYYKNQPLYSPITVMGLGLAPGDEYLPYQNLTITGNVVRERATDHALYLNSAQNVTISGNDFGSAQGERATKPLPAVYINFAKNVTLSDNLYSPYATRLSEMVAASGHRGITGSDLGDGLSDDPTAVETAYSTAFLDHLPTISVVDGVARLHFAGAWAAGWLPTNSPSGFQPYQILTGSGWYAESEGGLWGKSGGMDAAKGYRFAALYGANAAIRYTAERSGRAVLRLPVFSAPYASGDGSGDGYFAIFVNGEMIWPYVGGSYTAGSDWYLVTKNTSPTELQNELSTLSLSLEEGDEILFVSKRKSEWSGFACLPAIHYVEE